MASFQRAAVDGAAARAHPRGPGATARGASCSPAGSPRTPSCAREGARAAAALGLPFFVPPLDLTTDNAAMIGAAGFVAFGKGVRAGLDLNAEANLKLG